MPNILDGIEVSGFRGSLPPVNPILLIVHVCLSSTRHMLRVIVLHEGVIPPAKHVPDERGKASIENAEVQLCVHCTCENADVGGPSHADSGPYVHLCRMLGTWLISWPLAFLSVTPAAVCFDLD